MDLGLFKLKSLLCMNVPNDVTAAPFSAVFLQLVAEKKTKKNAAAVTSLRTFVRSNNFRVSNGTGQCNVLGQRDRSSLIVRGQSRTTGRAQNLAMGQDGP
jgi:hypothetical protein